MQKKVCPYDFEEKSPTLFDTEERLKNVSSSFENEPSSFAKSLKPVGQKVLYTKKESFLKLLEIQELALSISPKPDFTAALRAEELKGKLFGLYQDKKSEDQLTEMLKFSPKAVVEWV